MKQFKNILLILLIVGAYLVYNYINNNTSKTHYVITADTNVSKVPGLSKYVSQEEVRSFGFRYWDIDSNYTKNIPPNLIPLRTLLKQKQTKKILSYMQDNNLSIDVKIQDGTTPLMYSSFYNDVNTSKILIKKGADVRAKDKYGLTSLAYAIENNSTLTARLLMDNGVKFEEIEQVQFYLKPPLYPFIQKLIIDGDKIQILYKDNWNTDTHSKDEAYLFEYIVHCNFVELAKMALENAYKPTYYKQAQGVTGLQRWKDDGNTSIERSVYAHLSYVPNYKPMLELLLKYDVVGKPDKKILKFAYDECYDDYLHFLNIKNKYESGKKVKFSMNPKLGLYRTLKNYQQNCPDANSTFKDVRYFFSWSNNLEKNGNIDRFLRGYKDDPNKVIFVNNNSTKEKNTTKKTQGKINVK